jgi:hypothetical protein
MDPIARGFTFSVSPEMVGDARERVTALVETLLPYVGRGYVFAINDEFAATIDAVNDHGAVIRRLVDDETEPRQGAKKEFLPWCADEEDLKVPPDVSYDPKNPVEFHSVHIY